MTKIQIFVKSFNSKTISLSVDSDDSVAFLKKLIVEDSRAGADIEEMRIVFAGNELEDERLVGDCQIQHESTVDVLMRLRGGKGGPPKIDPNLLVLAQKHNQNKMICRKCYARLDVRAKSCRKKKCGHCNQLRPKSVLDSKGASGDGSLWSKCDVHCYNGETIKLSPVMQSSSRMQEIDYSLQVLKYFRGEGANY
ncbi:Ubiquitin-60S ribosomal protein L40 [Heracleum sosnowskyi]|uniref:Ubiquitin-60S ribosomal protein L40 n=1 Tax=Heracleum sosnowskyi TaxID=360622 RepID=A0AAD8H5S5_9APIA|nr:Ubiquitin-60S ribosomal protein L40 [Heracleum sosnowskyi]